MQIGEMNYQNILVDINDKIICITLNRPKTLNALTLGFKQELEDIVSRIEQDKEIWGVIITGTGKAFSSGTDINDFPNSVEKARTVTAFSQRIFNRIENLEKPVIAAVNGYALGGGLELALCCDLRVFSSDAKVGFPEVKIGAIPCYGGTQRLTRLIGAGNTKNLIYTGKMLQAQEALQWGLANEIVEPGKELEKAKSLMREILQNSPMAVAYAKECINKGADISLESALLLEQLLVGMLVGTHDMAEGTKAFLEKRQAKFNNS